MVRVVGIVDRACDRSKKGHTSRTMFITRLMTKYITPCFMSVFPSVEDDSILKSPAMVNIKSSKS